MRVYVIADDEAEALRLATCRDFWRDSPKEALSNADELPNCRAWSVDVDIVVYPGVVPQLVPRCQLCGDAGRVGELGDKEWPCPECRKRNEPDPEEE